jgi:6-phosphogluconolactonase
MNFLRFLRTPLMIVGFWTIFVRLAVADDPLVFVSAFAGDERGAIHAFSLDLKTGALTLKHRTPDVRNGFYMAVSRDNKFLYAINAPTFGGKEPEQVAAYQLEGRTGRMKLLNKQSTHGTASCYLDVDATGRMLLVANYVTGNVASFPIEADGSLKPAASTMQHEGPVVDVKRQQGPHAHCFVVSPDNKYAFAADLGLDKIFGYAIDPTNGTLKPTFQQFARTPPRAGPRHLTFHPHLPYVYVINEIENSVTRYFYHAESGTLIEQQTISTIPADYKEETNTADLKITPDGQFLYATNRGHDSLACYAIGDGGRLTLIEIIPSLGKGPQNLAITAGGEFALCANMPGNNLVVFQIDRKTGKLTAVGQPIEIPSPSCILIR